MLRVPDGKTHFDMSAIALSSDRPAASPAADGAPILRWMIFTGTCAFAVVLLWRYNLLRLMVELDRTYISSAMAVFYVGASLHCLWSTIAISREGDAGLRLLTAREVKSPVCCGSSLCQLGPTEVA